jgi:zinc ribbon protein
MEVRKVGVAGFAILGAVLGAILGFLLRPSAPFLGQLPLQDVLTRGQNLTGLDVLLRSTAEQSFNDVVIGAILGAVVMALAQKLVPHNPTAAATGTPPSAPTPAEFCPKCGAGLNPGAAFCASCGTRTS